jgi:hypothetical protein
LKTRFSTGGIAESGPRLSQPSVILSLRPQTLVSGLHRLCPIVRSRKRNQSLSVDYLVEKRLVLDRIRWDQSRKYTRVRMRTLRFLLGCLLCCLPGFIGLSSTALAQTPVTGEWAWMSGSNVGQNNEQSAVYGTLECLRLVILPAFATSL